MAQPEKNIRITIDNSTLILGTQFKMLTRIKLVFKVDQLCFVTKLIVRNFLKIFHRIFRKIATTFFKAAESIFIAFFKNNFHSKRLYEFSTSENFSNFDHVFERTSNDKIFVLFRNFLTKKNIKFFH